MCARVSLSIPWKQQQHNSLTPNSVDTYMSLAHSIQGATTTSSGLAHYRGGLHWRIHINNDAHTHTHIYIYISPLFWNEHHSRACSSSSRLTARLHQMLYLSSGHLLEKKKNPSKQKGGLAAQAFQSFVRSFVRSFARSLLFSFFLSQQPRRS